MNADNSWRGLYLIGGIAALLALAGTLSDIILAMLPGWEASTVPATIKAWFRQLETKPLLGLRNLDLLNVAISVVQIPAILVLCAAHRRASPAHAALALIVVLVGTTVFVNSNAALPMLGLSRQYPLAPTDAERRALEASGLALLARGAHGSMGIFLGVFLSSLGTLLLCLVILAGRVFSRLTGWVGIVGIGLLLIYTIVVTFVPEPGPAMMVFAIPGGILLMLWNVLIATKLFQMLGASG